jgi:hypothetical protein
LYRQPAQIDLLHENHISLKQYLNICLYTDPNTGTGVTFSTEITTQEDDEPLGVLTINENDPEWSIYSNGKVRIYLKGNHTNGNTCL